MSDLATAVVKLAISIVPEIATLLASAHAAGALSPGSAAMVAQILPVTDPSLDAAEKALKQ